MSTININDRSYSGNNVSIVNSNVFIDGKEADYDDTTKEIKVIVEGDLNKLDCHDAVIKGNVLGDVDAHNVSCGNINGSVDAHNVNCDKIGGDVDAHNVMYK